MADTGHTRVENCDTFLDYQFVAGCHSHCNLKDALSMKRVVILGAGESGTGSAMLAQSRGFDVFVSDAGPIAEAYRNELSMHHIQWEQGQHSEACILNADEVIKSPGIPEKATIIQALRRCNVPIISEIEFAARYTDAKIIAITGSNG